MSYETLKLENHDKVWVLTIHRPEALNALNAKVIEEMTAVVKMLSKKSFSEVAALVVTGSGEKSFVAGGDIREMSSLNSAQALKFAEEGHALLRGFENLNIPVIAAVNGFALGGGCELALGCDFIYASENAKFALPEVTLGLMPGFGGTVRLSRVVGQNKAKELTYTGEMITAAEAHRIGLVNKVFPLAELLPAAIKAAQTISLRAPVAIAHAKKTILKAFDSEMDSAVALEAKEFSKLFDTKDMREGTTAFLEKRKPQFTGI